MSFDKLMAELAEANTAQEALVKSLPAEDGKDDPTIAAAAEDGGEQVNDGGKKEGGKDDKPMAKSLTVTLEDGTTVEALDGEAMIKSLTDRLDATESTMAKALTDAVTLIKGQGELIKSLSERIGKLGNEGRGRKAVVTLTEKPATTPLAKSESEGMKAGEFMAKAMGAMKAGRLTSTDIAVAETSINRNEAVPSYIVQAVMAA